MKKLLVLVLPVALVCASLFGLVVVAGRGPVTCGSGLKVMSFNIRAANVPASGGMASHKDDYAWPHRGPVVADWIAVAAPDLLGLQEAAQMPHGSNRQVALLKESLPGYTWVHSVLSDVIAFKTDAFTLLDQGVITLNKRVIGITGKDITRRAVWAKLRVNRSGQVFFFLSLHAQFEQSASAAAERSAGWTRLVAGLDEINPGRSVPTIITGDFNALNSETTAVYRDHLVKLGEAGFVEAADQADASSQVEGVTSFNGWGAVVKGSWRYKAVNTAGDGNHIDYVWTRGAAAMSWDIWTGPSLTWKKIEGENTAFVEAVPSDHWPVLSTVQLGVNPSSGDMALSATSGGSCQTDEGLSGGDIATLPGNTVGEKVTNAALAYSGLPYSWGGGRLSGPSYGFCCSPGGNNGANHYGFDCSGLVLYAWGRAGKKLPHSAHAITHSSGGTLISRDLATMQPGDVIGFSYSAGGHVFHVGIYMGGGRMINSDSSGVGIDSLTHGYYAGLSWRVVRFG